MKTIGILGGMGPVATAELYMGIVEIFQQRFDARYDADYPPMIINSIPAPDVVEKLEDEARTVAMLRDGVRTLEKAGAGFIVIACNTVHQFHRDMADAVTVPVINLLEETAQAVKRAGYTRVGVLGTGLTVRRGLYRLPCETRGIELVEPDDRQQSALTALIMDVLSGRDLDGCRERLDALVRDMKARGSQAVILGCTDLSSLASERRAPIALFDTTRLLAEVAVRECLP